jgi:anti-anti-sigma factor
MDLAFRLQENTLVCTFPPRLDTAACERIDPEIRARMDGFTGPVAFDLEGVDYVSSAFLRICITTAMATGMDRFSCIHVSPRVKKVFKIAGLDQAMKIE